MKEEKYYIVINLRKGGGNCVRQINYFVIIYELVKYFIFNIFVKLSLVKMWVN